MGAILPEAMRHNPRWRRARPSDDAGDRNYVRDDAGNLVGPDSADPEYIGLKDPVFMREAALYDLCSACGTFLGKDDIKVFLEHKPTRTTKRIDADDETERVHRGEAPMHLACAEYAARACPKIRQERWSAVLCKAVVAEPCRDDDCDGNDFFPDPDKGKMRIVGHDRFLAMTRPRIPRKTKSTTSTSRRGP